MKLVIVESPTKAKTISRFLSDDFKVVSSYGHVRDLPKSKLGVDVEHDFTPTYIIPVKSRKMYINYTIPEMVGEEETGCIVFLLGYKL